MLDRMFHAAVWDRNPDAPPVLYATEELVNGFVERWNENPEWGGKHGTVHATLVRVSEVPEPDVLEGEVVGVEYHRSDDSYLDHPFLY